MVQDQSPDELTVVVHVSPLGPVTVMMESGSPVPTINGVLVLMVVPSVGAVMVGPPGAVLSKVKLAGVSVELPAVSVVVAVSSPSTPFWPTVAVQTTSLALSVPQT